MDNGADRQVVLAVPVGWDNVVPASAAAQLHEVLLLDRIGANNGQWYW